MKVKHRILLISPISEYKSYILPRWLSYVKSLYRSYNTGDVSLDVLLCDNSQNKAFHKQIERKYGVDVIHVDPMFKNSRKFICESRNRLREHFLSKSYNAAISLECDIFPHANFLTELITHKKKLVAFPYFIGEGALSQPMIQMIDQDKTPPHEIRNISTEELFLYAGKTIKVFNPGLGCTLIHRSILEQIEFRVDDDILMHDDSFFAEDCYLEGIPFYCDTSMVCRHLNKPWNYFPENKF
jgi:hypothetical protein